MYFTQVHVSIRSSLVQKVSLISDKLQSNELAKRTWRLNESRRSSSACVVTRLIVVEKPQVSSHPIQSLLKTSFLNEMPSICDVGARNTASWYSYNPYIFRASLREVANDTWGTRRSEIEITVLTSAWLQGAAVIL